MIAREDPGLIRERPRDIDSLVRIAIEAAIGPLLPLPWAKDVAAKFADAAPFAKHIAQLSDELSALYER